jgi:hypothetical protein
MIIVSIRHESIQKKYMDISMIDINETKRTSVRRECNRERERERERERD